MLKSNLAYRESLQVLELQALSWPNQYFDYAGAIHVHTQYSHDCTGKINQIIDNINQAGLDYLLISDHDNMDAHSFQGWHGTTLCLVGQEISTDAGHYLAFNITPGSLNSCKAQEIINQVNSQGGLGFIAHPQAVKHSWKSWQIAGRKRN